MVSLPLVPAIPRRAIEMLLLAMGREQEPGPAVLAGAVTNDDIKILTAAFEKWPEKARRRKQ